MERIGINNIIKNKSYNEPNNLLILLEFIINMLALCERVLKNEYRIKRSSNFDMIIENTKNLIERFGLTWGYSKSEEKLIVIENNPAATAAAEISKRDIAVKIMQYNHYLLKGDINKKRHYSCFDRRH
jgi:hypothetical protein